jgi:hypothetical protein
MIRVLLIVSLAANTLLGVGLYRYASDYESLRVWACDMGNGGHDCGED